MKDCRYASPARIDLAHTVRTGRQLLVYVGGTMRERYYGRHIQVALHGSFRYTTQNNDGMSRLLRRTLRVIVVFIHQGIAVLLAIN